MRYPVYCLTVLASQQATSAKALFIIPVRCASSGAGAGGGRSGGGFEDRRGPRGPHMGPPGAPGGPPGIGPGAAPGLEKDRWNRGTAMGPPPGPPGVPCTAYCPRVSWRAACMTSEPASTVCTPVMLPQHMKPLRTNVNLLITWL